MNNLYYALNHDMAELATGDVPATTKWNHPLLAEHLSVAEEQWELDHNIVTNEDDHRLLKTADMLELVFFARDQLMLGNKNAHRLHQRGILYVRGLYPDGMPERVHRLINHVIVPPLIEE